MSEEMLTIPFRFRGPPRSGNGGYVGGVCAELLGADAPVEVTLRAPVPLDVPLGIERGDGLRLVHGETLIAEAREAELELELPSPPSYEEALAAQASSASFAQGINPLIPGGRGFHPVCFCCGTDNPDGMRVYAAPVGNGGDDGQVAAAWQTDAAWGDADGMLPPRMIWTALDCPGQFAFLAGGTRTGLLGRITADVKRPAPAGERYVVTGFCAGVERKKHFAGTAVFDGAGQLVAAARSVWIGRGGPKPGTAS